MRLVDTSDGLQAFQRMTVEKRQKPNILTQICRECGREHKIPIQWCKDCWRTMQADILKK